MIFISLLFSMALAHVNLGFLPQDSQEVPTAVQQSQSKIYQIEVPYYVNDELPPTLIRGTAFLDEDPLYIWTNCHIVATWMSYQSRPMAFEKLQEAYDYFHKINIPITLKQNGQVVLSTDEIARVQTFNPKIDRLHGGATCNAREDIVKIKLGSALSESGLPWVRDIKKGEELFIGGYPRPTSSRAEYDVADSSGQSFYWTRGSHLHKNSEGYINYAGESREKFSFAVDVAYTEVVLADSAEGMSGGPVFNSHGQIVGVFKGFLPVSEEKEDIPFLSVFIPQPGMRFLELYSNED